jgi:ActR/RegA family two-component response regulator
LAAELGDRGYQVFETRSEEAADWALRYRPQYAIIEFEHTSTLELLRFIREQGLPTRAIVSSSVASPAVAWRSIAEGATAVLPRPLCVRRVLGALQGGQLTDDSHGRMMTLEEAKMRYIEDTLLNTRTITEAADVLGVDRRSLRRMLQRLALSDGKVQTSRGSC